MFPYERSTSAGGPAGFIAQNLAGWETDFLSTTPALSYGRNPSVRERLASIWRAPPGRWLRAATSPEISRRWIYDQSGARRHRVIWFHDAGVYAAFADLLGKEHVLMYQPHCPQLPWEEYSDPAHAEGYKKIVLDLVRRASVIVLPNRHCLEIYHDLVADKDVVFFPSGSARPSDVTRISLDPSIIHFLFIGRRTAIKGFDLVLDAFRKAWTIKKDIRLVVCGGGERLKYPGIVDVGYTDRIHDWISSVNLVVNANRQSYFDLSVMEALSIGTPIALTPTQGHKEILEERSSGVISVEPNVDAFVELFLSFSPSSVSEQLAQEDNRKLYANRYSTQRYRERISAALPAVLSKLCKA